MPYFTADRSSRRQYLPETRSNGGMATRIRPGTRTCASHATCRWMYAWLVFGDIGCHCQDAG
jgi:hypothetical protein